jgi:hypothetical protein
MTRPASSTTTFGRRAFIAGTAGALAGATLLSAGTVRAVAGASNFQSVQQRRLCDTRSRPDAPIGFGYQSLGGNSIRVGVTNRDGVPADAVAAVLTVTAVSRGGGDNFVTVYPSGEAKPDTSSLNAGPWDGAVANLVTIKLGGGAVDLTSYADCDLLVDLVGVYRPAAGAVNTGRLRSFPFASRALDTRPGPRPAVGTISRVNLTGMVPSDAVAVVGTLTAVTAGAPGFVTAFPRGSAVPDTSNLNVGAGETRAVGVITKIGTADGIPGVDLYNFAGAHLLFDVVGYMTGPSDGSSTDGLFVPISPTRVFDSRRERLRSWNGWTRQFALPAPINTQAQAVAMNLTTTGTVGAGYMTVYAGQTPRYDTSNLNVTGTGQTIANHAITPISDQGVSVYSSATGHVICDVMGWYTGAPVSANTGVPVNPAPPGGPLPWVLQVPRMGLNQWVFDGDATRTVDSGNTWHWAGTGLVGQGSNAVMFGHRTAHGGPYRTLNFLQGGDLAFVTTSDGRRYTYRMAGALVTSKYANDILGASRRIGGETISLVACSQPNGQPTNLSYRLVSTFQFVGWEDLG